MKMGSLSMRPKPFRYLLALTLVGLSTWAALLLHYRYPQSPWTRDGEVRANIVDIAPRVSGPIARVTVHDNQPVHQGDLLFEIDPEYFQAQIDLAAGQVQNAEANLKQQNQKLQRQIELSLTRVNAPQDLQNAQDNFEAAWAQLASAKANLELARLNLG
jgi:multidrug resistance efflux pump